MIIFEHIKRKYQVRYVRIKICNLKFVLIIIIIIIIIIIVIFIAIT
jgi:uncharacterized integral membrane protein